MAIITDMSQNHSLKLLSMVGLNPWWLLEVIAYITTVKQRTLNQELMNDLSTIPIQI